MSDKQPFQQGGTVRVDLRFNVPYEEAERISYWLREQLEEEGHRWEVHRSGEEIKVTAHLHAPALHNGTVSALLIVASQVDSILTETAELRFFKPAKMAARMIEVRDPQPPEEEEGEA